MLKKMHLINVFCCLLMTGFILSCGEPQPAEDEAGDDVSMEVSDMDNPDENGFLYMLPSPLQIASIFRRSGFAAALSASSAGTLRQPRHILHLYR